MKRVTAIMFLSIFVLAGIGQKASAQLHSDPDTGKWIKDGFDIEKFAQLPEGIHRLAVGKGGAFGTDIYAVTESKNVYRFGQDGQATLVGQLPVQVLGMAFPYSGSSFGEYIYFGSGDGYWAGDKTIYRMDPQGNVEPFFDGSNFMGGTMNGIQFSPPNSAYGEYLFTQDDNPNQIYRIGSDKVATTFSSDIPLAVDFMFDTYGQFDNQLIVSNIEKSEHGSGINALFKVAPDGTKTTLLDDVFHMGGGVITPESSFFSGNLYLVENYWPRQPTDIYSVSPDGSYELFAQNFDAKDETNLVYGPDGALYVLDRGESSGIGTIYRIVPEPVTMSLFVFGGLVILRRKWS